MAHPHLRLGVNIDHVATIRNARGGRHPDPVRAAKLAIAAGADGITAHLREDRRHISDDDIARLKAEIAKPLNLEMAATAEMVAIARAHPAARRLPRAGAPRRAHHRRRARRRRRPERAWPAHRRAAGSRHPGVAVHRRRPDADRGGSGAGRAGDRNPHRRLVPRPGRTATGTPPTPNGAASARARRWRSSLGLEVHAGHGLDYASAEAIAALPEIVELNIGHFLVGEAVFVGLAEAVRTMRAAMERGRARVPRERAMILGIGSDIIDMRRIAKVIERHGERFLSRIFTETERARAERRKTRVETYAKRFAAKEACAKALGTGIRSGVWWRDMGVVNLPSGRPTMRLTGGALRGWRR